MNRREFLSFSAATVASGLLTSIPGREIIEDLQQLKKYRSKINNSTDSLKTVNPHDSTEINRLQNEIKMNTEGLESSKRKADSLNSTVKSGELIIGTIVTGVLGWEAVKAAKADDSKIEIDFLPSSKFEGF